MTEEERRIRREMLILAEKIDSWYPWHCDDYFCRHHFCSVRIHTLNELRNRHAEFYVRWRMVRAKNKLLGV